MPLERLAQDRWKATLDQVSTALAAQRVTVEVAGLGVGDQVVASALPLIGLAYDPRDDTLTVSAEGLDHRVRHPRTIHLDREFGSLHSLEAVDAEGNHHIVQLSEALRLPPP